MFSVQTHPCSTAVWEPSKKAHYLLFTLRCCISSFHSPEQSRVWYSLWHI